jgi:hypothetical protein
MHLVIEARRAETQGRWGRLGSGGPPTGELWWAEAFLVSERYRLGHGVHREARR